MADESKRFLTGDGRSVSVQDIVDLYRDVVSQSRPTSGKIKPIAGSNSYILTSNYDTLDCDQLEILKCSKTHLLTVGDESSKGNLTVQAVVETNGLVDVTSAHSRSGKYLARIKSVPKGSDKKQILEIWGKSRLLKSIDVSELEAHDAINTDSVFSSFCWSKFDENKLLYVCEKKKTKHQSYFKQDLSKDLNNLTLNHGRSDDWGECLVGIEHTVVAVLDVENGFNIEILDMEGYSLGDTDWINSQQTVSVAYPEQPRRLGLIYCNNRPSVLVVHDWSCSPPKEVRRIQHDALSLTHPRVFEKSGRFVYLAAPIYGAHQHAQMIYLSDMERDQLLVGSSSEETCHFVEELPRDCFLCGGRYIVFVRSKLTAPTYVTRGGDGPVSSEGALATCRQLCFYDLDRSTILDTNFPLSSAQILDVHNDIIFAVGSEINVCPSLFITKVSSSEPESPLRWQAIDAAEKLADVVFEPFKIPTPDGSSFIGGFLVSPDLEELSKSMVGESVDAIRDEKNLPTIVLVHGGPHSAFILNYTPALTFYARLGLRTLCINYRGSTGVSEEYLSSLVGRVGEVDVNDCLSAIRHFAQSGRIDPNKLIIQGGSHGGFLSAHLSCQTEFKFTSAVIRNPVIDLSSMHATTDIPDWCYTEALGTNNYQPSYLPSAQELTKMYQCSPLFKARNACVPTLMLLGNQDKRVPMFQGERWYQLLKARGVETQCKVYDDKHDLAKPEAATDGTITAVIWILTHLNGLERSSAS